MAKVVDLPVEKIYPRTVRGREIWAQCEPPDEMVWEVCPYLRMHLDECRCMHCPKFQVEKGAEHYGEVQRGCYGLAAEVCRIVFAVQKRG